MKDAPPAPQPPPPPPPPPMQPVRQITQPLFEPQSFHNSNTSSAVSMSKLAYNPNKIDLAAWNQQQQAEQQINANYNVSKDGVHNLKQKFYQPTTSNKSRSKIKLVSHENYLFNSKNAQQNQCYNNEHNAHGGNNDYEDSNSNADYTDYKSYSSYASDGHRVASSDL